MFATYFLPLWIGIEFATYFLPLWIDRRYYELRPDDPPYAAKFYDCCGAEDPEALGCTTSFHVSYDDD